MKILRSQVITQLKTVKSLKKLLIIRKIAVNRVCVFKCEDCEYKNKTEKGFKQHIAGKHKEYQCEICSFKNASKATAE